MKHNLKDLQENGDQPMAIMCHNINTINISKPPVMYSKTMHIPIKYHLPKEKIVGNVVKLEYIPSKEKISNIFTKSITRYSFEYLRQKMGVISS